MRYPIRLLAAAALSAAVFAPPAQAQDLVTQSFGGTTIWVGGGVQYLSLPDIKFTGTVSFVPDNFVVRMQKNSDFDEYGGAIDGGIETALGFWGNHRVTGAIKGFWTNVEGDSRTGCRSGGFSTCFLIDPTGDIAAGFDSFITDINRDVDYWGGQAEFKFARAEPVHVRPNLYRNDYFIVGADIRGIDQDNKIRIQSIIGDSPIPIALNETLDTTYYGGYVGFGGEYTIPIIGGIGDGWGLRTFISGRAGLYNAETDYDGRFVVPSVALGTRLVKSNDELAFIGSVSLETRKPIGQRSSLSLWTDYEYISSVPEMHYNLEELGGRPTRIGESDAFAARTMLRLNIGLGSAQLYQEPLK